MLKLWGKKAQSTAEYAILIALVVGAVAAMQVYVKRGIQGRIKDVVDFTGSGGAVGTAGNFTFQTGQYEPYYLASDAATKRESETQEVLGKGGEVGRATAEATAQSRQQVMGWTDTDTATAQTAPDVEQVTKPNTPNVERVE